MLYTHPDSSCAVHHIHSRYAVQLLDAIVEGEEEEADADAVADADEESVLCQGQRKGQGLLLPKRYQVI
jgi:hypothetical protein